MTAQRDPGALREIAEDRLAKTSARTLWPSDPEGLVHELEVHRVELEMQVEQLTALEREVDAAKQKYQDLYDFAPVGYLVLGPQGILEANRAAAKLLGLSPSDLAGRSLTLFVVPSDVEKLKRHERDTLESGRHLGCELGLMTQGGERRDVRLESQRTSAVSGRWRSALIDVTEEKRLERQFFGSETSGQGGTFARSLAHDLGHLLMAIVASAEVAVGRLDPESPAQAPLAALKHAALYGGSIVSGLLGKAARGLDVEQVTDLNVVVARAQPLLRQLAGEGVRLRVELEASDAHVLIAPAEVMQILLNLASNARDALGAGGELVISTADAKQAPGDFRGSVPRAGLMVLSVTDDGAGMSAEVQARAFEPRFTTKGAERGTGLGLSSVYGIVKRVGGDVRLKSQVGEGTSVRVYLPRSELKPVEQSSAVGGLPSPDSAPVFLARGGFGRRHTPSGMRLRRPTEGAETLTLLVVEDDAATRAAYQELLGNFDLHVIAVGSGREALALFREHAQSVCAVLCDFNLPDVYGIELARQLREIRRHVPILFVSGRSIDDPGVAEILDRRTRLLTKPVDVAQLIDVLGRLIDSDLRPSVSS
jgi:PAS domain S-box-containing protein